MKHNWAYIFFLTILCVLIGCQPKSVPTVVITPTIKPTEVPIATVESTEPPQPVLEIVGINGESKYLTLEEIQKMAVIEGQGGIKSSTGQITLPALYKGVPIKDLVELTGQFDGTMGVRVEANDGYGITYSYDQITKGTFIVYDPSTGEEIKNFNDPITAIVAFERDGATMDIEKDGVLRLSIISPKNNQVADGHWSVKWVTKIIVKALSEDWVLQLEGTVNETMDRGTFESGAAPGCHHGTWTDEKAQVWTGIPLWLMVGRVDDEVVHNGPAYNDALADQDYAIEVIAVDGYSVTFNSKRIKRNDEIILAYMVNDTPLTDKYFPLRVVGNGLEKNEIIGAVAKIVLHLDGMVIPPVMTLTPEPTATQEPTVSISARDVSMTVTGLVGNELNLSGADIQEMEMIKITAKHPKKDEMVEYEGIRLNTTSFY